MFEDDVGVDVKQFKSVVKKQSRWGVLPKERIRFSRNESPNNSTQYFHSQDFLYKCVFIFSESGRILIFAPTSRVKIESLFLLLFTEMRHLYYGHCQDKAYIGASDINIIAFHSNDFTVSYV